MNGSCPVDMERAEELKQVANLAFNERKFQQAIDLYTQAIEANPKCAVYYANRAFAHTKLEEYGSAVEDATTAIELDRKYVKGYYRRGTAYLLMGKFKEALKDFRQVVRIRPNDPDAKRQCRECEKAVQKIRFEEAIWREDTVRRAVSETIDISAMEVDDSYTGPRLKGEEVTLEFVKTMMEEFRKQKSLHKRYAYQILLRVNEISKATPTLVDITVPEGSHITVCGDIHGQYYDLLNIFEMNGLPSDENPYLFNGDFVDRGSFSVEVIFTLFAFKCLYPNGMYLSRGNHETKGMNKIYGFDGEVKSKFDATMSDLFQEVFCALPLANVLNGKVIVVHGGLFSQDGVTLQDIRNIDRFTEPPDEGLMCELLWSDPQPDNGRSPSKRGVGVAFGPDVTSRFLQENNLELIVRSHEVREEGCQVEHNGKLITVFSAPNYCDQMGNMGAYIRFESDMVPKFTKFKAVPHPNVKPMQYATNFMNFLM